MNLKEIYALPPIKTENNIGLMISGLKDYGSTGSSKLHLEVANLMNNELLETDEFEKAFNEENVECHFYLDESDSNQKWGARLFSVFYKKQPLMLVKNYGRYFSEYYAYISNEKLLKEVLADIAESIKTLDVEDKETQIYDENENIEDLELVNSYSLFDYYDPTLQEKYKVGDIVWGWVKENHLNYEDNYVLTKVKIIMVNKFKSSDTYFGSQINRRWGEDEYSMKMQFVENVMRGIGCTLNDSMIVGLVDEIPMPEKAINNFIDKDGYLNEAYKMTAENCICVMC